MTPLLQEILSIVDAHTSTTETIVSCRTEEVPVIWDIKSLKEDITQAFLAEEDGE